MIALSTGTESSMKAMESDMIEEMVKDVNDGSICIKTKVGDEDSTMISKLRTNIDTNIGKTLDAYHVKEILRNHLYCEKITHNFNFQSHTVSQKMFILHLCPNKKQMLQG